MSLRLALAVLLASTSSFAADDVVRSWAKERASEHAAVLESPVELKAPEGQLYRTRPPDDVIAHFTPPTSLAPLVQSVRAGVVNVRTTNAEDPRGAFFAEPQRSLGSGFVLSEDGYVVTNNHVIQKATSISVRLADGREFPARVVGADPSTDVALLKLSGSPKGLPTVYLGDSDALAVGDWVLAIGNPFGLDYSVSHGMISAKERAIGLDLLDDFLQTDALINPGNSGGPLFNMSGDVIGVTTAIISQGQGIGFAVPINMVKDLLPNLRANGRLARGWLGVTIQGQGSAADPNQKAAIVKDVYRNSPAAKAGLRSGDRVLAVNGRPITSYLQMLRRIAILAPGTDAKLSIQRGANTQDVTVHLAERPAPETLELLAQASQVDSIGLLVRPKTDRDDPELSAGVIVTGVMPGSPAERAGVAAGDGILEVNRRKVTDLDSWQRGLEKAVTEPTLLLKLQRGDSTRYLAIER